MAFLRMNQINRWRSKLTVLLLLHWREGWRGINLRFTSKRRFKFYSVDGILDISALQCERNFTPIIFEVYLAVSHINIFRQTLWQLSPIVSGMINWDVFQLLESPCSLVRWFVRKKSHIMDTCIRVKGHGYMHHL